MQVVVHWNTKKSGVEGMQPIGRQQPRGKFSSIRDARDEVDLDQATREGPGKR